MKFKFKFKLNKGTHGINNFIVFSKLTKCHVKKKSKIPFMSKFAKSSIVILHLKLLIKYVNIKSTLQILCVQKAF